MHNSIVVAKTVIKELIRRKDFYFILALLIVIILFTSSASFGGETDFQRYFKEVGVTLAYAFSMLIAITFAARQIPDELESKTAYVVLAHPLSRAQFIMGKFFGVFCISAASFTLFYGVIIVSLVLRQDHSTPALLLLEGYLLYLALLAFMISLTILLSFFLSILATTWIALLIYFGSTWFGGNVQGYIFFPHPELFDIKERLVHSTEVIPAWIISFLLIYAAVYSAIFLAASNLVFRRRNL